MQAQRLDSRLHILHARIEAADEETKAEYQRLLDLSWIYHDSALEGVVYNMDELKSALESDAPEEGSLIPIYDEIRQNRTALDTIRDLAQ